jgi:ABC-type antimicrobial peptide transport system permease subunit
MTAEMSIVARAKDRQRLTSALREVVNRLDPDLVIVKAATLDDAIAFGLSPQRLLAAVTAGLGGIGLALAAIGIYGITAYGVATRRQEIGIRLALGAQRHEIIGLIVRGGMRLCFIGASAGLALAAGVSRVLSIFLYGLPPVHGPTFAGTAALFLLVGLAACYIPSRRATAADVLRALRDE